MKEERFYKFTEKSHPPVPILSVGDICYSRWLYGGQDFDSVEKQKIRKVEVKWYEASEWEPAHWEIHYYIKGKMHDFALKSEWLQGDDRHLGLLYLTPNDVMQANIEDFLKFTESTLNKMSETQRRIGGKKSDVLENLRKLLPKKEQ